MQALSVSCRANRLGTGYLREVTRVQYDGGVPALNALRNDLNKYANQNGLKF